MENSRKIWFDENSQPPKNYIWYKNGAYWEWIDYRWVKIIDTNEIYSKIGNVSELNTEIKTDLVSAINEIKEQSGSSSDHGQESCKIYDIVLEKYWDPEDPDADYTFQHYPELADVIEYIRQGYVFRIVLIDNGEGGTNYSYLPVVIDFQDGSDVYVKLTGTAVSIISNSLYVTTSTVSLSRGEENATIADFNQQFATINFT